ncbi:MULTISPECIES: peptidylprolyl isomerase [Mammaliicoccus]|uniref:peptidylprolyl isomerase n=1 Tax=Mammaliicoccus vitulinus TaxID=71237 RepID=A0A2T4PSI8_9STAP|nr:MULTISPECIES: foldase protein PrsA [Mammaliicoccus]HAL09788.1 peptidylprolyl isomerase [Staphylococcus sp.]PTI29286.1 peptidylprolyl isomerase [Mammaliicoccus vitulinus]PTI36985.1 peptidylprolyl isomerase [Mammaliicoccus vitulinus]PTI73088.1 peptidylprolyl isomerase [Mammaliicoccus vitulinus]RIN21501.1 peptidylprolyl isomerase [Mammaliicoccus vitulinus]
MKSIKKIVLPITLSASVLTLGACGNGSDNSGETLVETKAGNVTSQDVLDKMGNNEVAQNAFQIVLNKVLKDKYEDKVDTKKLDEQVDKQIEQYGGKKKFEEALQQEKPGATLEDFKESQKTSKFQEEFINDAVNVSDKEIDKNTKKGSHILIKVKSEDSKDGLSDKSAKKKADELLAQIKKNPDDFDKIAKKESQDEGTKDKNGSLGFVLKGQMDESFEKALFDLKDDEISDVVKSQYGYHIIRADKGEASKKEKDSLKEQYRQMKIQKEPKIIINAYKKLLDEYKVDYKDKDIKKAIEDNILNEKALQQQQMQAAQQQSAS